MGMRNRELVVVVALALCLAGAAGCGGGDEAEGPRPTPRPAGAIRSNPDNARTTITVGSKYFTEQQVLGEIFAQALAAAGYRVATRPELESERQAISRLRNR